MIPLPIRPSARAARYAGPGRDETRHFHFGLGVAAAAALAALFPACATYEPEPLLPSDELELLRARTLDESAIERARPGQEPSRAAGFDLADGLDERELIAVALTLNPPLRARRLEIGESEALLIGAGLWPNPELGLAVRPGIESASSTGIELDLLFELLRPGERRARRGVALARLDVVRAEVAAFELRIVAETRKARVAVLAADENERLLAGEAALREQASALLVRRQELGEASDLDRVLVDLERIDVQRELREARAQALQARGDLNALLGLPPSHEIALTRPAEGLAFATVEIPSDEDLDRRLLAGRFDLHAQEARYGQAEQELRLAIARQYPGLGLGPSYEKDVEGSEALGLAAAIEIPLFDRNQGEIAEKRAARERARAEYVAMLHALRAAAHAARAELARARAEVEVQRREVLPLIERTESLFEGAFRARELSIFEWITARGRALQARRELLRAMVRQEAAGADLEAALGVAPDAQDDGNTDGPHEER